MHVGKLIHQKLQEKGHSVTWFASKLYYTRPNVYKIFGRESVDTRLLERISSILEYDFFKELSDEMTAASQDAKNNSPGSPRHTL